MTDIVTKVLEDYWAEDGPERVTRINSGRPNHDILIEESATSGGYSLDVSYVKSKSNKKKKRND